MSGISPEPALQSNLADFETTTADLLRPTEALALLNFGALFNEVIYLPDTAIGDHKLIIESFRRDPYTGLFHHVRRLIEEKVLRVSMRDKVVVGDKLLVPHHPTIREIFEGWRYRDKFAWSGGDSGFTASVEDDFRISYLNEIDRLLQAHADDGAIRWYDPDVPKRSFREYVLSQLNADSGSLRLAVSRLPSDLQTSYFEATTNSRFTNADLWRVLRKTPEGSQAIILHAHINQQCFADAVDAYHAAEDRIPDSLASFNFELRRARPHSLEVDATIEPPKNMDELMERAAVRLPSVGVELFARLSVSDILKFRRVAGRMFQLARKKVEPHKVFALRKEYLLEVERYWTYIMDDFRRKNPDRILRQDAGLFFEEDLPSLRTLYRRFDPNLFAILLRLSPLSVVAPFLTPATNLLRKVGVLLLHKVTPEFEQLRAAMPPITWQPRGMLNLERTKN